MFKGITHDKALRYLIFLFVAAAIGMFVKEIIMEKAEGVVIEESASIFQQPVQVDFKSLEDQSLGKFTEYKVLPPPLDVGRSDPFSAY